jgi:hypothetical protein
MSNQPDYTEQPSPSLEDVRQHLIAQINEGERTVEELSDEELEIVTGGGITSFLSKLSHSKLNQTMEKKHIWDAATGASLALSFLPS